MIDVVLPWDLFRIAEQLGESYGKWIQITNTSIAAGVTVSATYNVPTVSEAAGMVTGAEVWWMTNLEVSGVLANAIKYTVYLDGKKHPGQTDIVVDEAMLGVPLCPPGEVRCDRSIAFDIKNQSSTDITGYHCTCFLRVISKWVVDLWDKKTSALLEEML